MQIVQLPNFQVHRQFALAPPGSPRPSAPGTRIVSTQRTIEMHETSQYLTGFSSSLSGVCHSTSVALSLPISAARRWLAASPECGVLVASSHSGTETRWCLRETPASAKFQRRRSKNVLSAFRLATCRATRCTTCVPSMESLLSSVVTVPKFFVDGRIRTDLGKTAVSESISVVSMNSCRQRQGLEAVLVLTTTLWSVYRPR